MYFDDEGYQIVQQPIEFNPCGLVVDLYSAASSTGLLRERELSHILNHILKRHTTFLKIGLKEFFQPNL
jgi:hypothetical protein